MERKGKKKGDIKLFLKGKRGKNSLQSTLLNTQAARGTTAKKYEKTRAMGKEYSGIKLVGVIFIAPTIKVASLQLQFLREMSIVAVVAENRNRTDGKNR